MDKHLSRSNSLNRVISSNDAFQLLVRNATNRSSIEAPYKEETPLHLECYCEQPPSDLIEAVHALIAGKPDPFGLYVQLLEYVF